MKHFSQKILQVAIMIILSMIVQIGYSQCLNCDVSKSNISAGYNNSLNSTWTNQSILGSGNTTNRNNAVAIGSNSQANWSHSYVFGSFSVTNGMHAYVIGSNSVAQTTSSFAFGNYAKSMFGNAHSIGNFTTSNQVGAYVFGLGISSISPLINNITNSLVVGFNSQYPTLFVSETPSNMQSGRVGIGNVTDPQAKLHIRADENEDASLLLEAVAPNKEINVRLGQNHKISATEAGNLDFETADNKHFVFHQGDIFLEDIQSGIIMKSPNGQCWRGTLTDQGMLSFVPTNCPEASLTALTSTAETAPLKLFPNPTGDKVILDFQRSEHHTTLQISTLEGKIMHEQTLLYDKTELSLSQFPAGTYIFVVLQNGQKIASGKVVRE